MRGEDFYGILIKMAEQEETIQRIREYMFQNDSVVLAFLFGSRAKGYARVSSDWDIGVYLLKDNQALEREIWASVEKITDQNVDLIVLNRAPAGVADTAIRGIPLAIKDQELWLNFFLRTTNNAIDFRKTAREYADIYWRSSSLSQEDRYALDRRLVFLDAELRILEEYRGTTREQYEKDYRVQRIVERTIENLMNAVIDAAKIILASEKHPIPQTYHEIIALVATLHPYDRALAEKLASWAWLRNILAHEYLDLRWKDINEFLGEAPEIIAQFISAARKMLSSA